MNRSEETDSSGATRSALDGFEKLLEAHPDPAWIYEVQSLRLVRVNEALSRVTEYPRHELLRMRLTELLKPRETDRRVRRPSDPAPGFTEDTSRTTWKIVSRSGRTLNLDATAHAVTIQGKACRLAVARLRTDPRQTAGGTGPVPDVDSLTGLPDRNAFVERIQRRIAQVRQAPGRGFAVLLIDLDRFKALDRGLGPEGSNDLLVAVARRLETLLHPDELVARLEGGEFAMLLEDAANAEDAIHAAREIQEGLEAPFTVSGNDVQVTASIGIAHAGPDVKSPGDLIRDAEIALSDTKSRGLGGHRAFAPELRARAAEDLRMEVDLRPGIERGDLKVRFQPIVSLRTGLLSGFEALVRWHHPDLGVIMPAKFIPMAERTGIIVDLGKEVMRDACRQVCEWQSRYRTDPPLYVTVNCSPAQFSDPKLVTLVQWALANSGLPPKSLKLELTESALMADSDGALRAVDRILDLGVQLMIDDFGTGYSSLSRLHQLPIESVKVDQSFVAGMVDHPDSLTMVRAIINLARNFDLKVTAEGVETVGQLRALKKLDCDFGQGYYFSKPLEPQGAERLISSKHRW